MTKILMVVLALGILAGCSGMNEFVANQQAYQLQSAKHNWLMKNPWAIGSPLQRGW